jgi:hypothetical protein
MSVYQGSRKINLGATYKLFIFAFLRVHCDIIDVHMELAKKQFEF